MRFVHASRAALAVALAIATLSPAQAAQISAAAAEGTATPAPQADAAVTEDITVTARRRVERSQDVPVAVTAIGGRQLEATRTFNLRDVQQLAPSLTVTVTNPRNTSINIRGLGNNVSVYNDGLEPAVGVYLDQVYLARPGQTVFDLVDLDRVEVLRGPQGTLFGKNTSAGAVVISTRAPSFTPEFGGDVSFANCNFRQVHAFASGPLVGDTLAGRLSISVTDRDGFNTNRYDGSRTQDYHDMSVRGQLLYKSGPLNVRVIGDAGKQHATTAAAVLEGVIRTYTNGTNFANNYTDRAARLGYTPVPYRLTGRSVDVDANPRYRMWQAGVSVIADYSLPGNTITSVTAARTWHWFPHNDGDGTSLDAGRDFHQSNVQKQISQELRIASEGTRRIDYVGGLYFLYQDIKAHAVNTYGSQAAGWFLAPSTDPVVGAAALNNYGYFSDSEPVTKSYAGFAQAIWHVTPKLDLTGGLRYTYETKDGYFNQYASGQSLAALTPTQQVSAQAIRARFGVANRYTAETSAGRLSGQATLAYKITPDVLAYATYARGNKFGGLNLANINVVGALAANPVIKPETIDSYEGGIKTSWFGGKLTANLAAFWTDDSDFQTTIVDVERNGASFFTNVGAVRSRGFELDSRAVPTRWLSLYASGTYDDARYVSYPNSPCPVEVTGQAVCDLSGARLPGVSKWAISAGGEVHTTAGEVYGRDVEVYAGSDYSYRSNFYTTANLSAYSLIAGYDLVNLRLGLRSSDGVIDLQLWGRNVFDTHYDLTRSAANTGAVTYTPGDPATYGVTIRTRF
ncbi:TonB-dependent receptor [Sphingomonas sp. GC_Shp_3]|uniref:TonB-dependent receptor n=1 Tax=Sphingomonas sp. GC_Shp_3 TaxID=2937383 RepID=UPI00226A8322|nr:TonB-dependent receptor [Sphingomonas sp. GC_Shp_3]